jgi:hypothetical protein
MSHWAIRYVAISALHCFPTVHHIDVWLANLLLESARVGCYAKSSINLDSCSQDFFVWDGWWEQLLIGVGQFFKDLQQWIVQGVVGEDVACQIWDGRTVYATARAFEFDQPPKTGSHVYPWRGDGDTWQQVGPIVGLSLDFAKKGYNHLSVASSWAFLV